MDGKFLEKIAHGNYSDEEIKAAFAAISSEELVKHLDYFIDSQKESRLVRLLSKKLVLGIKPKDLAGNLLKFIEYQKSDDQDVQELASELAHKKTEEQELINNLEALFDYQASDDKDVRRLAGDLILKISPEKIINKLAYLQEVRESRSLYARRLSARVIRNIQIPVSQQKVNEILSMII